MGFEFCYIAMCLKTVCSGFKSPISQGQFQCYSISVAVAKYNSEEIPDVINVAALFIGALGLLPHWKTHV